MFIVYNWVKFKGENEINIDFLKVDWSHSDLVNNLTYKGYIMSSDDLGKVA